MVNNSKVRLMTKLAVYENRNKEDFKLGKYYKSDYIKINLIKTVLSVTAAYLICLGLLAFYNIEFLISNAVGLDYKSYGLKILGVYIIFMVIFVMTSLIVSNEKFVASRKRLNRYYKKLKHLGEMYKAEDVK